MRYLKKRYLEELVLRTTTSALFLPATLPRGWLQSVLSRAFRPNCRAVLVLPTTWTPLRGSRLSEQLSLLRTALLIRLGLVVIPMHWHLLLRKSLLLPSMTVCVLLENETENARDRPEIGSQFQH